MLKDFNSKTVGIFGAGFVGENVIKKLAKSGHRIKKNCLEKSLFEAKP